MKVYFQIPSESLEITLKNGKPQFQARCSDNDGDDNQEKRHFGTPGASYKFEKLIFLETFKFH